MPGGAKAYYSGKMAEEVVALRYEREGSRILSRRWRGSRGEIDIIAREGDCFVFIEVKKSRDFATAARYLGPAQIRHIFQSAQEFLANEPTGSLTEMRFDVALVDERGGTRIMRNVLYQD